MVPPIVRERVIFLYYEKKETITVIAEKVGISPASAFRIVQSDERYVSEKEKRKLKEHKKQKGNKEKLIKDVHKYFEDNYTALDYSFYFIEEKIAEKFGLQFGQVCEILKKHPLYKTLEKARKLADEEAMNKLHQIEINLTVKKRKISKQSLLEFAKSAYDYDPQKGKFVFNKKYGKKPADLPASYSVHTNLYNSETALASELKNKIEEEKRESEIEKTVIEKENQEKAN